MKIFQTFYILLGQNFTFMEFEMQCSVILKSTIFKTYLTLARETFETMMVKTREAL